MAALSSIFLVSFLLLFSTTLAEVVEKNEIQVINSGTGRTGSTSVHEALNILGYKSYHLKEIFFGGRGEDLTFWEDAYTTNCSKPEQLRELFASGHYTASAHPVHWPCLETMILELYPNAKVIHTQRTSAELWHDSVSNSICRFQEPGLRNFFFRVVQLVIPVMGRVHKFVPFLFSRATFGSYEPIENVSKATCMANKDRMIAHYHAHNQRIHEIVPPERLLVITNHQDGWTKLCQFLDKPVPDVPFPHVNQRESMVKTIVLKLMEQNLGLTPGNMLALAVVAIGFMAAFVRTKFSSNKSNKVKNA